MPRLSAALLACTALLVAAAAAGQGSRRIAVLQPDDELVRAISLSLLPWGVDTIQSDEPLPEPSQPEAVHVASRLASRLGVEAVVWVSPAERGSLLWVYDARAGDVTTRLLAETPPFDSAAAAAVALSVKTVLRASAVAPPAERFGAQAAPLPPPPPAETPGADHTAALELGAGGTWVAEGQAELQLKVAAVAWLLAARRIGVSLEVSSGPGFRIDDELYQGHFREVIAGGKARFRWLHEPTVSAVLALGGALHWTRVEGTLVESSLERSVSRLNASLDGEASVSVPIGTAAHVGVSLGAAYTPTYQRYLVEGTPVFSPWPVAVGFGGYCGIELF